jgi:hypothetical protein
MQQQPAYLLCSRSSSSCVKALKDLESVIPLEPQIKVLWIEDHSEILPHHKSLHGIVYQKKSTIEQTPMTLPSIAHFNNEKQSFLHYEGRHYLEFISNFIRDKRTNLMKVHLDQVKPLPNQIIQSGSTLQKMLNHSIRHYEALPVGHVEKAVTQQWEHTTRYNDMANNPHSSIMKNITNHAQIQAKKLYDQTLEEEQKKLEEFVKNNPK